MKKKLLAILSAAVMCLSAIPIAGTAVSAEENSGDILPDWIPESFSEALEFENTYGATHIEDGVVCLLFSETTHESYSYEISATTDVMTEVSRNTYTEDLADFKYEVVVYKPFANGSFEVDLNRKFQTATFVDYSFDFYVDEDGTISETDIYAWAPDCITEYNDFAEKNGTVSVHGGYIAYCYDSNAGAPFSLVMEQNGTAEIKQITESECTEVVAHTEVCGGLTHSVMVYQPVSDGTVDISWKIGYEWDLENTTKSEIKKSYEVSENGTVITEIAAAPDENTQRVSVVDYETGKLLQFSDAKLYPISFHTGYEIEYVLIDGSFGWSTNWGPTSEWDYNGQNPFVIDIADFAGGFGVAEYEVINIDLPRGYYLPDDYLEVKEYDNNSADIYIKVKKTVNGDINADETFSVADAVLLQKWQVNAADTKLSNWRNADLNGDEKLDVFDSCLMRSRLIEQNQSDTKPVLMIEDYQITMSENGWGSEDFKRIITQNGTRYTAENVIVDIEEGYEWKLEDDINYIMNSGTEELFIKDSDILQKISDFTESAAQYKDCEMESWNFSIDDWGQEVLYALYTDENGSYQMIELCRLGGECAWLNNAEVQEFVTMLIENGYFGDKGILSYYLENK